MPANRSGSVSIAVRSPRPSAVGNPETSKPETHQEANSDASSSAYTTLRRGLRIRATSALAPNPSRRIEVRTALTTTQVEP